MISCMCHSQSPRGCEGCADSALWRCTTGGSTRVRENSPACLLARSISSSVRYLSLLLLYGTICVGCTDGLHDQPEIVLTQGLSVLLPSNQEFLGASLAAADDGAIVWTASGKVFDVTPSGAVPRDSLLTGSLSLRAVSENGQGGIVGLLSGHDTLAFVSRGERIRVHSGSRVLAASAAPRGWRVLAVDSNDTLRLASLSLHGELLSSRTITAISVATADSARPFAMSSSDDFTFIAGAGAKIYMGCVAERIVIDSNFAVRDLLPVAVVDSATLKPLWRVASLVALGEVGLLTLADLRSDRRALVTVDRRCRIQRTKVLEQSLVPPSTSMVGSRLLAAHGVGSTELIWYTWAFK